MFYKTCDEKYLLEYEIQNENKKEKYGAKFRRSWPYSVVSSALFTEKWSNIYITFLIEIIERGKMGSKFG